MWVRRAGEASKKQGEAGAKGRRMGTALLSSPTPCAQVAATAVADAPVAGRSAHPSAAGEAGAADPLGTDGCAWPAAEWTEGALAAAVLRGWWEVGGVLGAPAEDGQVHVDPLYVRVV